MTAQSLYNQTAMERVYLGRPAAEALAEEAGANGARKVFLVASATLARETDEIKRIEQALGERHAGTHTGIPAHVPRGGVLEAAAAARGAGADLLVSIGGGSVTDATKIVALCLKHEIKRHEDFDAFRIRVSDAGEVEMPAFEGPDVRVACVPTTLSGGEFNPLSGATDEQARRKQGYQQRRMAPVAVVLDPQITLHTPQWLWLSTGVRAVDHAAETLGSLLSNPFCDGMAANALGMLAQGLRGVKRQPGDLAARLQCQTGAWQSMVPLVAGVPMGISHATGHALGGTFDVPHGHTSCVMASHALAWNARVNGERQLRISTAMDEPGRPAAEVVGNLIADLGMPTRLTEVGVGQGDLPELANAVLEDLWARTNARPVASSDDVLDLLRTAL